ncbi:amidohydrolase family protein [Polaribacter cellanae]|uniref:Amidohydrolase n=1 Tax=Polaribacter cellanae TaxID=2818493 RepID=A0A975CPF6_9FLAO|nr:amidohydrolase [Polaribacter cellanae]QTE22837.1 amidohydrolase [Polaribacter cellanae]
MNKKEVDIIIKNGQVLTINSRMEIIENGVLIIQNKTIVDLGSEDLLEKYTAEKVIDAQEGIVIPGMVNSHCHLPMIAFRGLGEEGIEDRLMGYFIPLEKEMLSRKLIYDATIHGAIDMAMSGVTTYADMYYHVDEMAKATKKIGLRALLGQTVVGFPVVDASEAYGGLDYAKQILTDFKDEELVSLAIAPHAPYTVSKDKLLAAKEFADQHKLIIHIHVAEFEDEKNQIKENTEKVSVIKYLNNIGFLGENVLLAHCNYVDDEDFKIIESSGAKIAHNPMANAKGATGTARIVEAMQYDIPIGIGTDGLMGSNVVDLFKVMTYTTTIQRIRKMDRTIMTPEKVVRMATLGGANALGMGEKIGSLEKGKLADIVIIETQSMNMIPNYDPYATLVFQANPHNVETTIVNGKIIVENRKLLTHDIRENKKIMDEWFHIIKPFGNSLAKKN